MRKNDVQILFTVPPVRHTKDGMTENQLSKSKLICDAWNTSHFENCHYLPIYEIMMDDLRGQILQRRLNSSQSTSDSVHLGKIRNAYFSEEVKDF